MNTKTASYNKIKKSPSSGFVQTVALLNGFILTAVIFFSLSFITQGITRDEYSRTLQDAGSAFVTGITESENVIRIISSIFLVAEDDNNGNLSQEIRRNIPNLSHFDQIVILYEKRPGSWAMQTIYQTSYPPDNARYSLKPSQEMITRLIKDGIFDSTDLKVYSDLEGMEKEYKDPSGANKSSPFALLKAVEKGDSQKGIIIGISRVPKIADSSTLNNKNKISQITIKEVDSGRQIYMMNKMQKADLEQQYSFNMGDKRWQIIMGFIKDKNIMLMEKIPYLALLLSILITVFGVLFIRNNYNQSERLSMMNKTLESKNYELEMEISERERLNEAIVKAERENRSIINSVSDVIFETDTKGSLLFLSAAWQRITGFDPDHSIGSDLFSILHVEEQDKQRHDFSLLIKGQKQAYRSFTKIRISDGTFRAVELAFSMIRQDDNKDLRVVGTITDVEERRRAERALAEAEKKYRTIVENAAGGLFQITPEGMFLSANPAIARILGYASVEEMLRLVKNANGMVFLDQETRQRFLDQVNEKGQIFGHEVQVLKKDKNLIWISENIRVVRDEMQNILYYEGSMEDITNRKMADEALREAKVNSDLANRAKTEFIANMSHELRTPLNAIIGFSEIIKNQVMGPIEQDSYIEYAADIHNSGKNLLKIINEILDLSKIESGKKELKESEVKMETCLVSCLDAMREKISEKHIVLLDKIENKPVIRAEEPSLKQVIRNILSNAIQFTPEGGRITLFTNYDHDGSYRISIADTGIGLSAKEIEKALSPFGQIDNALDRSGTGTGLGLPLSNAIIKIHGGDIEILSEKGIGTTVSIILPAFRIIDRNEDGQPGKETSASTTPQS